LLSDSLIVKGFVKEQHVDQTARMLRLAWIHAGRKRTVGFVMALLI
jgi:hypothetical protein